jgi:opacity protein-like surface antigen
MAGVEAQIGITKNLLLGGSYLHTAVNNYMWVRIEDNIADWSDSSTKSDYMNQQWQVSLKYQINGRR